MTRLIGIPLVIFCMTCQGQSLEKLTLKGNYSSSDSVQITESYVLATQAVNYMYDSMNAMWEVKSQTGQTKKALRRERWESDSAFGTWLGPPEKIAMAHRKITRIHARFKKKLILEVTKKNRGKCTGWISAWTIPFGKVRIRLCEDFFIYRTHLQEKILIHEVGHEVGMLLHRRIHGCRAARRAATSAKNNIAKRSTENYAWLAMSYLGLKCPN